MIKKIGSPEKIMGQVKKGKKKKKASVDTYESNKSLKIYEVDCDEAN